MKIAAIIPARGGSKGIENKNMIEILGKPLLWYTLERCNQSTHINRTYVSSDSEVIGNYAEENGAIWIKRPKSISDDNSTSEEAIRHVLNNIDYKPDIVVFLQATSPLRVKDDIDNAIVYFIENKVDSLFSSVEAPDLFLWEKVDGTLFSTNHTWVSRERRQDRDKQLIENGSIYIFKPHIILEFHNRLGGKIGNYMMEPWTMWEIDEVKDLDIIKFYLKGNEGKSSLF